MRGEEGVTILWNYFIKFLSNIKDCFLKWRVQTPGFPKTNIGFHQMCQARRPGEIEVQHSNTSIWLSLQSSQTQHFLHQVTPSLWDVGVFWNSNMSNLLLRPVNDIFAWVYYTQTTQTTQAVIHSLQVEFLPTPNLKFNSIKKMSRRASYLRNYNLVKKKRSTKKVFFYQIGKFPTYLPFLKMRTSL